MLNEYKLTIMLNEYKCTITFNEYKCTIMLNEYKCTCSGYIPMSSSMSMAPDLRKKKLLW